VPVLPVLALLPRCRRRAVADALPAPVERVAVLRVLVLRAPVLLAPIDGSAAASARAFHLSL
jgi:hypothetical protein